MNSRNIPLQQRLQSAECSLEILRQNLSQLPAQPDELSETIKQLSLIQSKLQSVLETFAPPSDELISVLNHEFLTPLTLIQGSLQLLAAGKFSSVSEEVQSLLNVAFKQTNKLIGIVRELLAYQQMKSGQLRIVPQQCCAAELVRQAAQFIQLNSKKVGVIFSVKPEFISVWADPHYIILLLSHLLSNAIKFSPTRSIVTLTATLSKSRESQQKKHDSYVQDSFNQDSFFSPVNTSIGHAGACPRLHQTMRRLSSNGDKPSNGGMGRTPAPLSVKMGFSQSPFHIPEADFVLFQIQDRGIGIPPDQLDKIFDCFYQVDRSDSRPYNGLGLGLALCHQIIQLHGGQLSVESTLGGGSNFYFTLPVSPKVPPWWVKIQTKNPQYIYYFGPFETAVAARGLQGGYLEDLLQEQAQIMTVEIKQCQPEDLTICLSDEV